MECRGQVLSQYSRDAGFEPQLCQQARQGASNANLQLFAILLPRWVCLEKARPETQSPESINVTLFGERVFEDVIGPKVKISDKLPHAFQVDSKLDVWRLPKKGRAVWALLYGGES